MAPDGDAEPGDRREPSCPHYPQCVGCGLIGVSYGEQLKRKRAAVAAAFGAAGVDVEIPKVVGSPRVFEYRNQVKLVARRTRHGVLLGVYKPGSHEVVDIAQCAVHHALVARAVSAVHALLTEHEVPIYDEHSRAGWLRYVAVRASLWRRTAQVILVVRDRSYRGERRLISDLRRQRGVSSIVVNENDSPGNVIFGPRFDAVTPSGSLMERIGPLRIKTRAGSFTQANVQVARRIYAHVVEVAEPRPSDVVVDLYSGSGVIALHFAPNVALVYGIESSPHAVLDAKENLRVNGIHNARFYRGSAGAVLDELAPELPTVDLITLNPPRKGADEETRRAVVATTPRRVVYVSCNPDSLARDTEWFAAHGYGLESVVPFDMLPQTDHVECVAVFGPV
jgi:23S rRNA (uracil1939-C5)-methyltransferase